MIIGLCGYKGSGKSVVANYLSKYHGFYSLNFKDALVDEMKSNLSQTLRELSDVYNMDVGQLFANKPPVVRALMQNYGTDVRRKDDPNYWVSQWNKVATSLNKHIVTDDVRFLNEADAVRLAGGIIIRIVRPDVVVDDSHISEREHLNIEEDFTIIAETGQHEKVYQQIESILKDLYAD